MSGTRDNLNENSKYTVLIAEDEKITREGVEEFLKSKGFNVIAVANGEEVLDHFRDASLVLLDIMMPRLNGIETLRNIRQVSNVPVIMLTALSDEGTQLTTFNELADDYISKPFSLMILLKRIESLLRRNSEKETVLWEKGFAGVDFQGYKGYYKGKDAKLTTKEIKLFKLLIDNKGRALSREYILSALWTDDEAPFDRVVDVYVKNLRKKLHLECLSTVKGVTKDSIIPRYPVHTVWQ